MQSYLKYKTNPVQRKPIQPTIPIQMPIQKQPTIPIQMPTQKQPSIPIQKQPTIQPLIQPTIPIQVPIQKQPSIQPLIQVPIQKQPNTNIPENMRIPPEKDTLFWCYFLMSQGDFEYQKLRHKNTVVEKQLKLEYVTKLRENKSCLKAPHRFDTFANLENNLANDPTIHIKTVAALCVIDKLNIVYIHKKTYFMLTMTDSPTYYVIQTNTTSNYQKNKYGFMVTDDVRPFIASLHVVEQLDKPVKGLSSYKVQELIDIANKLGISVIRATDAKKKTKNELYESIVQYFS